MNHYLDLRDMVSYFMLPCDPTKRTGTLQCPVCGNKSLRINFQKNIYNCPACEEVHGGILDFWALQRGITESDKKERYRLVSKDIRDTFHTERPVQRKVVQPIVMPEEELASTEERHNAYSLILDSLDLKGVHQSDLIHRGLSNEEIKALCLKTAPKSQMRMVLKKIGEKTSLSGIPGIYRDEEGFKAVTAQGFLIPQKDIIGNIQGCQIRMDEVTEGKYRSYSSANYPNGTKSSNFVHVASPDYKNLDLSKVIITEGPLKADIINHYVGGTVIAVPGVNSLSRLPEVLRELSKRGVSRIAIAYDMDYTTNKFVLRGLDKLKSMISLEGMKYTQLVWDKAFKGYDDYLKAIS